MRLNDSGNVDRVIARIASRSKGIVCRRELLEAGVGSDAIGTHGRSPARKREVRIREGTIGSELRPPSLTRAPPSPLGRDGLRADVAGPEQAIAGGVDHAAGRVHEPTDRVLVHLAVHPQRTDDE